MLSFNSFRSKRYLRSKFVEGKFFLASEATDLELELIDLVRNSIDTAVGNVFNDTGLKVERLSSTELLVRSGQAWLNGLPFSMRSSKDQLVSGNVLTAGIIPAGVSIVDDVNGEGKRITFSGSTPSNTYRIVLTAEEQVISVAEDPFLQNPNLTETTGDKLRLIYKINVVEESLQDSSPVPYTNDTSDKNLVNEIFITPTGGGNGEQLSIANVPGSETIDGRDVEIIVKNAAPRTFPTTIADQDAFKNGKFIDSRGTEYHLNAVFNDTVANQTVLRIDKESSQPDPILINTVTYSLKKADVYVTEDNNANPRGKSFLSLATAAWDGTDFVHNSSITDLRNPTKSAKDFQDGTEYQLGFNMSGGGIPTYVPGDASFRWTAPFKWENPYNGEVYNFDTPLRKANFLAVGDSIVVEIDFNNGGTFGKGELAVTSTNVGPVVSLSGSPNLSDVSPGNTVVDSSGNVKRITAVDDVNDTITLNSAFPGFGSLSLTISQDVYEAGFAPQGINSFVIGTFQSNPTGVYHKGHPLAKVYNSNIRGTANERPDERIDVLTDAVGDNQEDRSGYFRSNSEITWSSTGNQVTFPDDIILELINTKNGTLTTHTIDNTTYSPLTVNVNDKVYILIDRTTSEPSVTLTTTNGNLPAQTQANKDLFVLFHRVVDQLHIPYHQDVMSNGQSLLLGASGTTITNAPAPIVETGTLSALSKDIVVSNSFDLNSFSAFQCGSVSLWIDGTLQLRNTGNSAVAGDGDYYEVDAGGGLSTTLRMNFADSVPRNYIVRGVQSIAAASAVTSTGVSTDNAVVRWNGTLGNSIQDSNGVTIDDFGNLSIIRADLAGTVTHTIENTSASLNSNAKLRIIVPSGSSGDPYINFSIGGGVDWSAGIDNNDSDKFKISQGTILGSGDKISITTTGDVTLHTGDFNILRSDSGSNVRSNLENLSNTVNSNAFNLIRVAGEAAGDPYTQYSISGAQDWSVGIDNSDSNQFKISDSASGPGTNDALIINQTGLTTKFGGQTLAIDGLVGTPSYAFATDSDTGIWKITSGRIGFACNGTNIANFDSALGLTMNSGEIRAGAGTFNKPSYTFAGDDDTGFFNHAVNDIGVSVSGTRLYRFNTSGFIVENGANVQVANDGHIKITTSATGADPGAPTNEIRIGGQDSSDNTMTLHLRTEQVVESIGTFTGSHKIKVIFNGIEYYLQLDAV